LKSAKTISIAITKLSSDYNVKLLIKSKAKHFVLDRDYKSVLSDAVKQTPPVREGHNKEVFMLNITPFNISNADLIIIKI
jgi:hypothetical protein